MKPHRGEWHWGLHAANTEVRRLTREQEQLSRRAGYDELEQREMKEEQLEKVMRERFEKKWSRHRSEEF